MLALACAMPSQSKAKVEQPRPKVRKYVIKNDCSLDLITGGPGDSLVIVSGTGEESDRGESGPNCKMALRRPIFSFIKQVNWAHATRVLLADLHQDGVYLVSLSWKLKRPFQLSTSGQPFTLSHPAILHCVCKEPVQRFQGRVGPISTFVPHQLPDRRIGGIWVSLFSDQIQAEFIDHLIPFEPEYRQKLKAVDDRMNQVMFFVANEAAVVGIQVMNTKREEKEIRRSKQVYHHERPLILQDGFYLVEGKFETTFLNGSDQTRQSNRLHLDCTSHPKIVIIGEGTHLIRTQTQPVLERLSRKVAKEMPDEEEPTDTDLSDSKCDEPPVPKCATEQCVNNNNSPLAVANSSEQQQPQMGTFDRSLNQPQCTQMSKIRQVEVCLDARYERIISLDHSILLQDFAFKLATINRQ